MYKNCCEKIKKCFEKIKLKENFLRYLIIVLIAVFIVSFILFCIDKAKREKEKPVQPTIEEIKKPKIQPLPEEVIKSLTAPEGAVAKPLPKKVIDSLTAPKNTKVEPLPEEVIKSLTAPTQ